MPDWSIKFVPAQHPTPDVHADFLLDVPHAKRNAPVKVFSGDNVSWNNATQEDHWPWLFDTVDPKNSDPTKRAQPQTAQPQPLSGGALHPRTPTPLYPVSAEDGSVIYFCCLLHPMEFACIVVVPPGSSSGAGATV
jgi:hypothetical protein